MRKHRFTMLLAAALLATGFTASAFAKSTVIAFDKLPAAVKSGITDEAGELKVTEVDKEMKDHKTVYEAKIAQADGKTKSFWFGEDGKLVDAAKAQETKPPEAKVVHEKAK